MRCLLLLALVILPACGKGSSEAAHEESTPAVTVPEPTDLSQSTHLDAAKTDAAKLIFQWPYGLGYSVTQFGWKEEGDQSPSRMSGEFSIQLDWKEDRWILSGGDVELRDINGNQPVFPPGNAQAVLEMLIPDQQIDPAGTWLGLNDYAALLKSMELTFDFSPEVTAKTLEALETPMWRETIENASAIPWRTWVEAWTGIEAEPGEEWSTEDEMELSEGVFVPYHDTIRFLGWVVEPEGHVLLERELQIGFNTQAMLEASEDLLATFSEEIPEDVVFPARSVQSITRMRIITDPKTLVPHHATFERVNVTYTAGEEPESDRQAFEWTFAPAK